MKVLRISPDALFVQWFLKSFLLREKTLNCSRLRDVNDPVGR